MDARVAGALWVESHSSRGRKQECPDCVGPAESGRGLWRQRKLKRWAGAMEVVERDERRFKVEIEVRLCPGKSFDEDHSEDDTEKVTSTG